MKHKKQKIIALFVMIIASASLMIYRQPAVFQRNSIYIVLGNSFFDSSEERIRGMMFYATLDYQSYHKVNVMKPSDYESNKQIDPPYLINKKNQASSSMLENRIIQSISVNLLQDCEVSFSHIAYKELGKEKVAYIGNFYMALRDAPSLVEQKLERYDTLERTAFQGSVRLPEGSIIKEVACLNPDIEPIVETMIQQDDQVSFIVTYDIKDYERVMTNMSYTLLINGEEVVYYGTAYLYLNQGGMINAGGYIEHEDVQEN